ncbi:MAG: DUF1304 domain-containing protein [Archangium sp.]|nr:DUF1304 domain-containing protein [Archangium sp.]
MSSAVNAVAVFVALQHLGFFVLESFLWTKPAGLKVFRNTPERAETTRVLAANQGVYNAFLAAGLLWSVVAGDGLRVPLQIFFFACVVVAGLVGGFTVSKRIIAIQAVPAAIGLVLVHL